MSNQSVKDEPPDERGLTAALKKTAGPLTGFVALVAIAYVKLQNILSGYRQYIDGAGSIEIRAPLYNSDEKYIEAN
jgi:hypothetical protein